MRALLAFALGLGLSAVAPAEAAQIPGTPSGVTLRAGTFFGGGGGWGAFGVEYPITGLGIPATGFGATVTLSGDYYSRGGSRSIPVLLNYAVRAGTLRYSAGVGVGFNRVEGGRERAGIQYQTSLAYDLPVGLTPVFLEGRYHRAADGALSGLAVYLGVRF
jgi:hypothetical protein